jgi:hypothetical protein
MLNKMMCSVIFLGLVGCSSSQKSTASDKAAAEVKAAEQKVEEKKAEVKKEMAEAGSCVNGSDKRSLEISKTEKGGCELLYNKNGAANKIAEQASGTKHCEEVKERIESKLKSAGFSCS